MRSLTRCTQWMESYPELRFGFLNLVILCYHNNNFVKYWNFQVKHVLVDSALPKELLALIWELADIDKDGSLNHYEFSLVRIACEIIFFLFLL